MHGYILTYSRLLWENICQLWVLNRKDMGEGRGAARRVPLHVSSLYDITEHVPSLYDITKHVPSLYNITVRYYRGDTVYLNMSLLCTSDVSGQSCYLPLFAESRDTLRPPPVSSQVTLPVVLI